MALFSLFRTRQNANVKSVSAPAEECIRSTEQEQEKELKQLAKNSRKPKKPQNHLQKTPAPKSTVEYLNYVRMMDDGICEIRDGLYSKTLRISDINYQTARKDDKLDIFGRYCEIINSIDPITHAQITILNRRMDYQKFRASMFFEPADDGYNEYRDEMNTMLSDKALEGQNGILREKYFTISTAAPDYPAAKVALARLETDFTGSYKSLGCDVGVLSGHQRLELLHSYTRPDDQFLFDYGDLLQSNLTTKHYVAPQSLDFSAKRTFLCGTEYNEVLLLRDLPSRLSDQLIARITELPFDLTVTVHIDRYDQAKALDHVQGQIAFMEKEQGEKQQSALSKGHNPTLALPQELRRKYSGAKSLLQSLEAGDQRMFRVTVLIHTRAPSAKELNDQVLQICSICAQKSCNAVPLDDLQREGFNSTLPLGENLVPARRTLTTASTAIFVPFTTQELYQPGGIYYGLNVQSHNMIFFSRYTLQAGNAMILGSSGSGKSLAAKREMLSVLMKDPHAEVIVIDPEREYCILSEMFGGETIRVSAGSKNYLNPMDISENYSDEDDPLMLKSEFILTLVEMIAGGRSGLSAAERSVVSRACLLVYRNYFANPKNNPVPTLQNFYEVLLQQPEIEAKQVALALESYITGTLNVFSHETNVDPTKRLVVYDVSDLGKQLRTVGMLIVLDQIWNRVTANRNRGIRTWIYIDEMQLLFSNDYCAQYFFELWSRARKWGAMATGITQNVETLLLSDLARRMLSNSDFIMLLNQAASDRVELAGLLKMSNKQLSYVSNVERGSGLLIAGKSVVPFMDRFPKDTKLYRMMSTKPDERIVKNEDGAAHA